MLIKDLLHQMKYLDPMEIYARQYRLICYISFELIFLCFAVICLYSITKLWYMVTLVSIGFAIVLINLRMLYRTANTFFCGHLLILVTFTIITIASYMIWGVGGTLHTHWYYLIPLLAAALVGRSGLIIYSIVSFLVILGLSQLSLPPFYHLASHELAQIEWVNHLFAYLVLITILVNLMSEHDQYEQKLNNKNYLLQFEKDKYHYLARVDQLTSLPNRRYFEQYLNELINTLAAHYSATIFFIDLDNFKYVNDCYGHNVGDYVLLETSRRLQKCFREGDFIARLGGDEFTAIVLHPIDDEQVSQLIIQRIIQEFEEKFKFEQNELSCTISIGLSTYPIDTQNAADLIIKADQAMYAAKKIKGNLCCTIRASSH